MSFAGFDPELLQDFLTESGELLEQLDQDLVTLETTPDDPELLNRVFRALHTIKGSASFLALTNLVAIAHVAEEALNAARNRVIRVDRPAMDRLLAAVDVIKRQFDDLRAGRDLTAPDPALVEALSKIGAGQSATSATSAHAPAASPASSAPSPAAPAPVTPFTLPPGKAELLEFFVSDLEQTLQQAEARVAELAEAPRRDGAAGALAELADALVKSVDFFDLPAMTEAARLLVKLAAEATGLPEPGVPRVVAAGGAIVGGLSDVAAGLKQAQVRPLDVPALAAGLREALGATDAEPAASAPGPEHAATAPPPEPTDAGPRVEPSAPQEHPAPADAVDTPDAPSAPGAANATSTSAASAPSSSGSSAPAAPAASAAGAHGPAPAGESTIRVEVSRLESLLNLVGELVLQKNRLSALTRRLVQAEHGPQELREAFAQNSFAMDRVTGDLQLAVMKTRMQPLDKIFGKYPRLVRDLARKLGKQIQLQIEGGETEVDKSVIEELGDPLIHLMRNSADHGIEPPDVRRAAGKPEMGTIRLLAANTGSHVEIRIIDDGKGLHPEKIAAKAVEKGLITAEQAAALSDREKIRLIFAAGFSTAEKISDVSGRGVGMDVVKTNIEKIKGVIDLQSVPGQGATVAIKIPLTVAIMNAMMVGVGAEIYAVPLDAITEIVKPAPEQLATIHAAPVMRLRESVLPLIDAGEIFGQQPTAREKGEFAVVLGVQDARFGLLVSKLIGQQEVVIKPLDGLLDSGGPVSGATVRDDGGVSLIVDVSRLHTLASHHRGQPA